MPLKLEDYDVISVIGTGSTGTCYKVCNKLSNELFVWKAVDYGSLTEDQKQLLISEVNLLKSLNHPNIVKYYGRIVHKETTTLYIITEWCEGGDLGNVIKQWKEKGRYLDEQFIWRMLYQISRAIQVCHSRLGNITIFHRDIKPANVFLDHRGNAKLGDFGLARAVQTEKEFSETLVGTPNYMSPELVIGNKYNRKSDIWALGCLVYELCALKPPFIATNMVDLAGTITSGKYKGIPSNYSENLNKVISLMLSKRHEFRPTIEMILHHPSVVIHVKKDRELELSRKSGKRSRLIEDKSMCCNLDRGAENLTLIDPEVITNEVYKEKWAEKHEALREKEARLRKREESIGYKEKSLANREKILMHLEHQTKWKPKQNKILATKVTAESGHETDMTVEPTDTPVRPTSTKLDPIRLPRPEILTNACKKLEKQSNISTLQVDSSKRRSGKKEQSTARRTLLPNFDQDRYQLIKSSSKRNQCLEKVQSIEQEKVRNKLVAKKQIVEQKSSKYKGTNQEQSIKQLSKLTSELSLTHENKCNSLVQKLRILKQVSNQRNSYNKENVQEIKKPLYLKASNIYNTNTNQIIV